MHIARRRIFYLIVGALLSCVPTSLLANTLVATNSTWRLFKGTGEASTPVEAWRARGFNDSAWVAAAAPFHFGESSVTGGTLLSDMRNGYSCIYLRQTFTLANPTEVASLALQAACDDGYVAWINGVEVVRYRVNAGALAYNTVANSSAPEPIQHIANPITSLGSLLVSGDNVLAIQAFNRARDNGDFQINLDLKAFRRDDHPPTLATLAPPPGPVGELRNITVVFSEAVLGVDEDDLLINDVPASAVSGAGTTYTFTFPQPPYGSVTVRWDNLHGITDAALPPNPFRADAAGATWTYQLSDGVGPRLIALHPPAGATLRRLTQIQLLFDESVQGLDAADLTLDGVPATNLTGIAAGPFVFHFAAPDAGPVTVAWRADAAIADFAQPPNPFPGNPWSYTFSPEASPPNLVINEFLAGNESGLADEDGDREDWIELLNRGATPINLAGWSLTDDPEQPDQWTFPSVSIGSGQFLVVFASGKNRRPTTPGARLHTNFKLAGDGEYLGLFNLDGPRTALDEFTPNYPDQRNDHSYGRFATDQWRYFRTPTPGAANGTSTITGVVERVTFSPRRGFYEQPFDLVLSNATAGAIIRYTTDGAVPTETTGQVYAAPIRVHTTTVVRAAAFRTDRLPSRVSTHTYLFPTEVLQQPAAPAGFPATWGSSRVTAADYGMDPRVIDDPAYRALARPGLLAIPSVSLVMPVDDWFSPNRGIYSNGDKEGIAWERAGSAELLLPTGRDGFQENCGLRIQGGTSTGPWKSYKLSLRMVFRGDYGPTRLEYPFFADSPVRSFNTLILDAGLNYMWHYGAASEEQRTRAQYVRDQFVSDLQILSGTPAPRGRFVHVYINGLYWGLHDAHEEPEAHFAAEYFGGDPDEYDVVKHTGNNVIDGTGLAWNAMFNLARQGLADPANYDALRAMLDVPSLIDYMLVNFYVGNTDWPHHNWYAVRRRVPDAKYRFISWDAEHVLKSVGEDRTGIGNANSPAELYSLLRQNPEFRLRFADHAHRHFFNGGMLYVNPAQPAWDPARPENNVPAALYHRRIAEIEAALVCESARWGDNQRPARPYTRNAEWLAELTWMRTQYFPQRSAIVLNQLRNAGLYPNVAAPTFNRHGGYVPRGFALTMSAPAGNLYYTLDGSDPRLPISGAVHPGARLFAASSPLTLTNTVLVKARVLSANTWSALTEATFQVAELGVPVRPTEIMYHPPGGDAYEFLELQNTGLVPLDLTGFSFEGIQFVFPPGTIVQPGQIIVLQSNADPAAFAARYPGIPAFGAYGGALSNGGETLTLKDRDGRQIWRLEYRDSAGWPVEADGQGASIELIDPNADLSDPANWRASAAPGGSPGTWTRPSVASSVRLNEVLAWNGPDPSGRDGADDWLELYHAGDQETDLGGWSLTDDGNARKFVFPTHTRLAPGDYLLVWCDSRTNAPGLHTGFGLEHEGQTLSLYNPAGTRIDALTFGAQIQDRSIGRDEYGTWVLTSPTPGAANTTAALAAPSELRLNEWLANPIPGADDWLELFNQSAGDPIALRGLYLATSNALARVEALAYVAPHGHLRLWANNQTGPSQLALRLPAEGGFIALMDQVGAPLDRVSYIAQTENVTAGRFPDGLDPVIALAAHTPGAPNSNDPTDSDQDGDRLPDNWERAWGLAPDDPRGPNGANGDLDADGLTNAQEWYAGTNPLDPKSALTLRTQGFTAQGLRLEFGAVPNRLYRVELSESLGASDWQVLETLTAPSSPATLDLYDGDAGISTTRFYRLIVTRP